MGIDDEERAFQSTFQEFAKRVDDRFRAAGDSFLVGRRISISFLDAPPRPKHDSLAIVMEELIRSSGGCRGLHEISHHEMRRYAPSFVTGLKPGELGSVTGAGLILERGIVDYYDVMCNRLAEKRDAKRYNASGHPFWIIMSVGLPLISLDALPRLFHTDLELKHVDRILVDVDLDLLVFERLP